MKKNSTYESLIDKSISSFISAIEIYNKPDFKYREEIFSILAVNSWELLLKAKILKNSRYKLRSIYSQKPYTKKNGVRSEKKTVVEFNRTGNPKTISINDALVILEKDKEVPSNLRDNIEALVEFRDNAVHFINMKVLSKPLQELGFACIKNYIQILKDWNIDRSLSNYNLYLMPLAYVENNIDVDSVDSVEAQKFINLVYDRLSKNSSDENYEIAVKIELKFQRGNSFNAVSVRPDKTGVKVYLTEDDIRNKFPLTYNELTSKAANRYSNFKRNRQFYEIMKQIKQKEKIYYERRLDTRNIKSNKQGFYSDGVWNILDKYYIKK